MKEQKKDSTIRRSGVRKVLLQMARRGDDWAGKATSFAGPKEYHFGSLKDLFDWLQRYADE